MYFVLPMIRRVVPLLMMTMMAGCTNPASFFQEPAKTSPHATLVVTSALKRTFLAVPAELVSVLEVNGKAPPPTDLDLSTFRLPPGPTHLFVRAVTSASTHATAHMDFIAAAGVTYRLDHASGVRDVAFMITANGQRVAFAKGEKEFAPPQRSSPPMFMPIIVPAG